MGSPRTASLSALVGSRPTASEVIAPLISDARLDRPAEVDDDTAARCVRPYAWLVDRAGPPGIRLTGAGYLPAETVAAAVAEFGLAPCSTAGPPRENLTPPVLVLRTTAQGLGLLRRREGVLRSSLAARAAVDDPPALWRLIAQGMPIGAREAPRWQSELLFLLAIAADSDSPYRDVVAGLTALGWSRPGRPPVTTETAAAQCAGTEGTLRWMGCVQGREALGTLRATPEGVLFARATLRAQGEVPEPTGTT
jgi:hypothetical protein